MPLEASRHSLHSPCGVPLPRPVALCRISQVYTDGLLHIRYAPAPNSASTNPRSPPAIAPNLANWARAKFVRFISWDRVPVGPRNRAVWRVGDNHKTASVHHARTELFGTIRSLESDKLSVRTNCHTSKLWKAKSWLRNPVPPCPERSKRL